MIASLKFKWFVLSKKNYQLSYIGEKIVIKSLYIS